MRLNLCLTRIGVCLSRRQADTLIAQGDVVVNGQKVHTFGKQVDVTKDTISVAGKVWNKVAPFVYWMLHKPRGVLVSRTCPRGRETIFNLKSLRKIRFPISYVGRLDYQSEGLLLMTNDGDLAFRLCHPAFAIPRTYHVLLAQKLTPAQLAQTRAGKLLTDGQVNYFKIVFHNRVFLGKSFGYWYTVTVKEGRNRLLRRIFAALDTRVVRLLRTDYAGIHLPTDLPAGAYRQLSSAEIVSLKKVTK